MTNIWDADLEPIQKVVLAYAHDRGTASLDLIKRDLTTIFKWIEIVKALNDLRGMKLIHVSDKKVSVCVDRSSMTASEDAVMTLKKRIQYFDSHFLRVIRTGRKPMPNDSAIMRRVAKLTTDKVFCEMVQMFFSKKGGDLNEFLRFVEFAVRRRS